MLKLNQLEKLKIEGYVLNSHGNYKDAIEAFKKGLTWTWIRAIRSI